MGPAREGFRTLSLRRKRRQISHDIDDVPQFENDLVWELNAMIYVWKLAVGLGYELENEIESYNAFARFNF